MSGSGETGGLVIAGTGLVAFVAAVTLTMTHRLDDVIVWVLGADTVAAIGHAVTVAAVVAVLLVLVAGGRRAGRRRVYFTPHRDHAHGAEVETAVIHEGHGHAAVGHGIGVRGIRARVYPDGSGWTETPRKGVTLAQSLAITLGGELAAGPSGCGSDRARVRRDLRRAPRRYRPQIRAEARQIAARHVGNDFGRRVAASLRRNGRFG